MHAKKGKQNKALVFLFLVIGKARDKRYVTLCLVEGSATVIIQIKDEKAKTTIIILKAIKKTL